MKDAVITALPCKERNATQVIQGLDIVLGISLEMVGQAEEGRWESFANLESERARILHSNLSSQFPVELSDNAASRLKELIEINESLFELVSNAQEQLATEMNRARRDLSAVERYLSVGG